MATPYENFTQGQQDQSGKTYDFWSNVFQKFNPQAPTEQAINTGQFYDPATANTMGHQANVVNKAGGNTGAYHMGLAGNRMALGNEGMENQSNYRNQRDADRYNQGEMMKYGIGGHDRMNQFTDIQGKMNQLPMDRTADNYAMQDTIRNMWDGYNASKPNFGQMLAGGLGTIGGTMLGGALGKQMNYQFPSLAGTAGGDEWRNLPGMENY